MSRPTAKLTPSSLLLVTGANGHVAQHVLNQLLSRPIETRPRIRATIRSESSAKGLRSVFAEHLSAGTLELVQVPDISSPGAFDDAVQGCTHVAHIASPLAIGAADTENDLLKPAIQGTTSLINSCLKASSNANVLQGVVITSSFAAVFDAAHDFRSGYTYTPDDWNPITHAKAADPNLDLTEWPETWRQYITYMASKKLAEKAAWDLYHAANRPWALSTILPGFIGGPCVLPVTDRGGDKVPAGFSLSQEYLWDVAVSKPDDKLPVNYAHWVDVRDVADAHVRALERPDAARGQRFIVSPLKTSYSGIADVVRRHFKELSPSTDKQRLDVYDIESKNCAEILGMLEWIGLDDVVVDCIRQGLECRQRSA